MSRTIAGGIGRPSQPITLEHRNGPLAEPPATAHCRWFSAVTKPLTTKNTCVARACSGRSGRTGHQTDPQGLPICSKARKFGAFVSQEDGQRFRCAYG